MSYGDDLHMAKGMDEFKDFFALIGYTPKATDQYAPYAAILAKHGWPRMLRAARQLHGQPEIFSRHVAALCHQYALDEAEAKKMAENVPKRQQIAKEEREARAAAFRAARAKEGV